jgi:hypothetical protein
MQEGQDDEEGQSSERSEDEQERTVHIRTYKFKTPQFIVRFYIE